MSAPVMPPENVVSFEDTKQLELEKAKEERLQQIEPIADLIITAAGRDLRAKEIRFLESLETEDLKTFTAMFTDTLNGYAAQGSYHPNDRFEDYKILITTNVSYL